jgi:hypothetical protein
VPGHERHAEAEPLQGQALHLDSALAEAGQRADSAAQFADEHARRRLIEPFDLAQALADPDGDLEAERDR